jgi:2-dehydropantoate 2-reductase
MRVVIFGTGGAGGYFGAQLARAGEDVIFIARGEHLNAIRMQGLSIETPVGEINSTRIAKHHPRARANLISISVP